MIARPLRLAGLVLVEPKVFSDERGFFVETFSAPRYRAAGIATEFVQDNHSRSTKGTLRGLHYQSTPGQAKLVRACRGVIFDVAVDLRPDSPTFGEWEGVTLDDEKHHQLFVPVGFAHGFCVVSDVADVAYKVSAPYDAKTECTIRYDDPELAVRWPTSTPRVSARDTAGEPFAEFKRRVKA